MAQRSRRDEAARQAHSGTCPDETRGVLVHVAGDGAGNDGNTAGERADERAVAGVTDDRIAVGQGACIGDPVDDARVLGDRQGTRGEAAVVGGEHAHRSVGEAAQSGVQQAVVGILGGGGRNEHERIVAGRQWDLLSGRLPHERADDMDVGGPGTWVLELGKGGDERKFAARAAVRIGQRRQADLLARAVEREPPALKAPTDGQMGALPEGTAGGGARQASPERVDRKARAGLGKDVGDERGARDTEQLRRRARVQA